MTVKNAFYAQSGGVTAVINATACGLIQEARRHPDRIGKVLAGRDGIIGALTEDLIDTSLESDADIARLRQTPSGAFGSCRYKLKSLDEHRAQYERLIEVFKAHDIGYFFYNGGNDSMDTAWKVSQISERMGYPVVCVGVPKTVDNDLPLTDCCPGFGSVAKYVATSIREAGYDVASMARTSTKVFVLEVMGRHAGWITAACGLAAENAGEPPHILLFPEVPFDPGAFRRPRQRVRQAVRLLHDRRFRGAVRCERQVDRRFRQQGCLRALAARRRRPGGGATGQGQARLQVPLGAGRLPAALGAPHRFAYRCRAGARPRRCCGQPRPARQKCGDADHPAPFRCTLPLGNRRGGRCSDVANVERKMPAEFISADGFHITEACRAYLQPLIEGEEPPPFRLGLPDYVRLKNVSVPRKLGAFTI